jgi:hypothetical protein
MFSELAVLIEECREAEFRSIGRETINIDLNDLAKGKNAKAGFAEILFQPADHDGVQMVFVHRDAAAEPLGVEDLKEGRETVRVPVVRRRREEQTMLEPRSEVTNGSRNFRVDGVLLPTGGSCVVSFVKNQKRPGPEFPQPVSKRACVGLVDEQPVRHQETGVCTPGINAEATLPANALHVFLVQDLEHQAKACLKLILPLEKHRGRAGDDDLLGFLAKKEFSGNQGCLDSFSQPYVIRDEEIGPREKKRLLQRIQLVGVKLDAGSKGRLKKTGVGRRNAIPAKSVQVGGEDGWHIEAALRDGVPGLAAHYLGVDFAFPEDFKMLALSVVVNAGELDERTVRGTRRGDDLFDEVKPLADTSDFARHGWTINGGHG